MSTPIEDDATIDTPRRYAPPWARGALPAERPEAPARDFLFGAPARGEAATRFGRRPGFTAGLRRRLEAAGRPPRVLAAPPVDPDADDEIDTATADALETNAAAVPGLVVEATAAPAPAEPTAEAVLPATEAPATAPEPDQPLTTWRRAPKPFAGDVAIHDLTHRLTLDPHAVPEPQPAVALRRRWRRSAFVAVVASLAAGAAAVLAVVALPGRPPAPEAADPGGAVLAGTKADRILLSGLERAAPVRLVLVEQRRAAIDERLPLAAALTRMPDAGSLTVDGLAPGTRLSAGTALDGGRWRLPLGELGKAEIVPPPRFVGTMAITLELRDGDDGVVDRSAMRIAWGGPVISPVDDDPRAKPAAVAAAVASAAMALDPPAAVRGPAAATSVDPEEIAILVKRGQDFVANGDLAAARLLLRRAADAGDAQAALLLGSTFDPAMLEKLQVVGGKPEPAQARTWYQRAAELGSAEAGRRLEGLARGGR